MQLTAGKTAVVTGAASGIGFALADRFARYGLNVVLADVEEQALQAAVERIQLHGGRTLAVPTDVSDEGAVQGLADATLNHFGAVHIVCNNAGVVSRCDPWSGPTAAWTWVLGVNLWGVLYGVRAFLPHLVLQGEGHIVNTASMAGLYPGVGAPYDASKHAVVALTEDLYTTLKRVGLPVGVSVLCPGWVRTSILEAWRNWPAQLGEPPENSAATELLMPYVKRAVDEGTTPAAVADLVTAAVEADQFWIFTEKEFQELAVRRWHSIAEGRNPDIDIDLPGFPSAQEMAAEIQRVLAGGP